MRGMYFTCTVDGCSRKHKARGYCVMHYRRWARTSEVGIAGPKRGSEHARWTGGNATYQAVHLRLRKQRGSAAAHVCDCGDTAKHWAYDNADPGELRHADGRRYSTDLAHYRPLCVPCHSRFDAKARV